MKAGKILFVLAPALSKLQGRGIACVVLMLLAGSSLAGPLSVPNTFQKNTTAVASDVNANFDAIENAVNDNDSRIGDNNVAINTAIDTKQNRVTGTCSPGSSVRVINADGSVECQVDESPGITGIDYNDQVWSHADVPVTVTDLGSVVISAPSAGTILLFLNGVANIEVGAILHYGIGSNTGSTDITKRVETVSGSMTAMAAYPVAGPGDYPFYAGVNKAVPVACCLVKVEEVSLVGLFVPNRY